MNQLSTSLLRLSLLFLSLNYISAQEIPLPEHPRPDFERPNWQNLNGEWDFAFDADDAGIDAGWSNGSHAFDKKIMVPFPWGSKLSGLEDEADIGWYQRDIKVSADWNGKRTFVTIGASDWETTVWLDGQMVGKHQGGYVPFSFELTDLIKYDQEQKLVVRVDDARRDFTLYGKQGYGNARGIWQTIYLEARGKEYLDALHFTPDIDKNIVIVTAYLPESASKDLDLDLKIQGGLETFTHQTKIEKGRNKVQFEISIPEAKLWTLDDPNLYEAQAKLGDDLVATYFGMRKISVENLPGTDFPYIALNNKPIYLQMALDQSYHPDGYYTFPSDQFLIEEIQRSKDIGLNGIRTHIKVEVPRKLYWADKLGLLVMEDLPNSWGDPDKKMREESTYTLKEMIKRDYNHPSIFSWVVFNETWGLYTHKTVDGKRTGFYLPETQAWAASMYYLAKSLDQTRLVEDNSICCGRGHTETDINSWHVYLPGWQWDDHLKNIVDNTYPGSTFDFEEGYTQGNQPNINSECGNVWGYDGSAGDIDWSYDYHRMINTFRKYPKIGGWLYTEHHDVINEWNGYWRFDRTEKETGMGEIVEGMTLNDFHADVYLSTGNDICYTKEGGSTASVPLYLSVMTDRDFGTQLEIEYTLVHTNYIGETEKQSVGSRKVNYEAWMQKVLEPLKVELPKAAGLSVLQMRVLDAKGQVLSRNFVHFEITGSGEVENTEVLSTAPQNFSAADWTKKQWNVREGRKINGAGKGYFEYEIEVPKSSRIGKAKTAYFIVEVSAKELFVKDQEEYDRNQDFMRGSLVAPSSNPNAYPMTDETFFPSTVSVSIDGKKMQTLSLPDDPADHRGILSWHHQLKDRKLREAGSYGYLIKVPVSKSMLRAAQKAGKLKVRLQAEGEGGIAIYGKEFGRFPFDPSLVVRY